MPKHAASHPWKRQQFGRGTGGQQFGRDTRLYIEIVEHATNKVERKLGPYANERMRDKADDSLQHNLDHERYYTRSAP